MYCKQIHVKIIEKNGCHGNGLIGTGLIYTILSSSINFMESRQISLQ